MKEQTNGSYEHMKGLLWFSEEFKCSFSFQLLPQQALIPQAMGSGNCITGLKAETVPEVRLVVKYHPRLGTSSATATGPRGLWDLPDKLACLY